MKRLNCSAYLSCLACQVVFELKGQIALLAGHAAPVKMVLSCCCVVLSCCYALVALYVLICQDQRSVALLRKIFGCSSIPHSSSTTPGASPGQRQFAMSYYTCLLNMSKRVNVIIRYRYDTSSKKLGLAKRELPGHE